MRRSQLLTIALLALACDTAHTNVGSLTSDSENPTQPADAAAGSGGGAGINAQGGAGSATLVDVSVESLGGGGARGEGPDATGDESSDGTPDEHVPPCANEVRPTAAHAIWNLTEGAIPGELVVPIDHLPAGAAVALVGAPTWVNARLIAEASSVTLSAGSVPFDASGNVSELTFSLSWTPSADASAPQEVYSACAATFDVEVHVRNTLHVAADSPEDFGNIVAAAFQPPLKRFVMLDAAGPSLVFLEETATNFEGVRRVPLPGSGSISSTVAADDKQILVVRAGTLWQLGADGTEAAPIVLPTGFGNRSVALSASAYVVTDDQGPSVLLDRASGTAMPVELPAKSSGATCDGTFFAFSGPGPTGAKRLLWRVNAQDPFVQWSCVVNITSGSLALCGSLLTVQVGFSHSPQNMTLFDPAQDCLSRDFVTTEDTSYSPRLVACSGSRVLSIPEFIRNVNGSVLKLIESDWESGIEVGNPIEGKPMRDLPAQIVMGADKALLVGNEALLVEL